MGKTFSILIPVYNVEKYLNQCIESVLTQNYENMEIILVDDGSTDNSGKICDDYAEKDSRIRVIHKENGGLLTARRTAVKEAKGEYFLFLDSDDYWEKGLLDRVSQIIETSDCDMVIFNYKSVYPDKQEENEPLFENMSVFEGKEKKKLYEMALETTRLNNLVLKVVKRDVVDIDNDYEEYFPVNFGEDALQSAPLLVNAKKIVYINDAMYCYRRNTGMTKTIKPSVIDSVTKVRESIIKTYGSLNINLNESIELSLKNYLSALPKYILYAYMDNPKKLQEVLGYVFGTEFYKDAKKTAYKKQSILNKTIIWLAEKKYYKLISVFSFALKIRSRLKGIGGKS